MIEMQMTVVGLPSSVEGLTMFSRNLETENDLHLLRAMLVDARKIAGHDAGYWHVGDLTWRYYMLWYRADPRASYRLWYDADRVIGFAVFGEDYSFDWQIHPPHVWRGIEEEMLVWALTRWDETDPTHALISGALENDTRRIAFLEQHGFARGHHPMIDYRRSLTEPIADSILPNGFVVRGVAGEHEAANRAEAHRQAFAPSRVTDEGYVKLMHMFEYDRELDVVTVSPDGIIAAYAMSWVDVENKIGEFEPVGARPDYQRKGLARAALLEGLRRMQVRGADTAIVCTNADNIAKGLYESVGFKPVNTEWDYQRKI